MPSSGFTVSAVEGMDMGTHLDGCNLACTDAAVAYRLSLDATLSEGIHRESSGNTSSSSIPQGPASMKPVTVRSWLDTPQPLQDNRQESKVCKWDSIRQNWTYPH